MSPQPLELNDVLSRFQIATNTTAYALCQQALTFMKDGKLLEAANHVQAGLRDSVVRNDRNEQAISCAYVAAVYVLQGNFVEAARLAEDCFRLFHQMGNQHNATVAQVLLAAVYRMHLEKLSRELTHPLYEAQAKSKDMESDALGRGQVDEAKKYRQQFVEFGGQIRRAKWIPAIPHLLPLIWMPVVDRIPTDLRLEPEIKGYMEPALFILRTTPEVTSEESGALDSGQVVDILYTARPLPSPDDPHAVSAVPPRLKLGATYVAVKIDPDDARSGFESDDYLLVRRLDSVEIASLIEQAGDNFSGVYFEFGSGGTIELVNAIPPRFVGEDHVRMFVAKVDAVLRRVP